MREIDILDPQRSVKMATFESALTLRFKVDRKVGTNKRFIRVNFYSSLLKWGILLKEWEIENVFFFFFNTELHLKDTLLLLIYAGPDLVISTGGILRHQKLSGEFVVIFCFFRDIKKFIDIRTRENRTYTRC